MKKPHFSPKPPQPPRYLRADGRELWKRVLGEYNLPSEALAVLALACQAQDRDADARRALDEHGTTFQDRWGQVKMRPEVLIERDSRQSVARLLKQLGLDLEPLQPGPGRPHAR